MTGIIIRTFIEFVLIVLLITGFYHEKQIIKFEEDMVWFYRLCKREGYGIWFFIKTFVKACAQMVKEKIG